MDLPERRRRQHRAGIAFVANHLIRQAELLEQPEDALRTRVFQMMDDDHGFSFAVSDASSLTSLAASVAVTPLTSRAGCSSTTSAPTMGPVTRCRTLSISRTLGPPGSWCATPGANAGSKPSRSTLM